MYHVHYRGTHYEAGFRWGALLLKRKNKILEHVPFAVTAERMEYAQACVPVYETYYPEILDEIRGLADGQQCDERALRAVLFSMYAMPPACQCSCFAMASEEGVLLGRNSDFLTAMERLNMNVIYRLTDGAYAFTGNTTAFIEMEDGVNEHRLAIGLTAVFPLCRKPGLNAGMLLRYFLEKCKTVPEVLAAVHELPIASAQTFTVADAAGNLAVIECCSEWVETAETLCTGKKFVCATNAFHLPAMREYCGADTDDWFAEERYQTLFHALDGREARVDVSFAERLLSGAYGFLCQYDRSTGRDTVWSVIYDLRQRRISRSEENPGRVGYKEDTRFSF